MEAVEETDGKDEEQVAKFEEHWSNFLDFSWCSQWDGKQYDIVFYGMSGYSGYLTMEYLKKNALKNAGANFTFAFAGRSAEKVAEMRDREFDGTPWADTPILEADFEDVVSIIDLVKSAKCIVNLAGPYMLSEGEVLVDACIWCKTDYVDVSQEIPWSLRVKELHRYAVEAGVKIVPSAAGSAYADLGVFVLAKKIREDFGEQVRSAACYCSGGGASAGISGEVLRTRAAMGNLSDKVRRQMNDPFALGGFIPDIDRNGVKNVDIQQGTGYVSVKVRDEDKDSHMTGISQDKKLGVWCAPHVNSFFDTRVVRRSNMLLADLANQPYGLSLNFMEYALLPPEKLAAMKAAADEKGAMPLTQHGEAFDEEMSKLEAEGRLFEGEEGPKTGDMTDSWNGFFLYAESVNGNSEKCSFVAADGYLETSRVAVETALTLVLNRETLPYKGGVLTPSVACGGELLSRLIDSGVKFKMGSWLEGSDLKAPIMDK
mmetsp:Transcript_263/g.473  ORF Transcript_263/g.473 Transcript_263/m.473 type:complete len:486 (+) Transcript_263:36-1493(+)